MMMIKSNAFLFLSSALEPRHRSDRVCARVWVQVSQSAYWTTRQYALATQRERCLYHLQQSWATAYFVWQVRKRFRDWRLGGIRHSTFLLNLNVRFGDFGSRSR